MVEIWEKCLYSTRQTKFEVSKERKSTNNRKCFLQVWTCDFIIICFHLLSDFDLLKVRYSEQHTLLAFENGLEVEKIVVFHLVMRRVRHRMMNYQILYIFYSFSLRISILNLSASFVMKVNDCHADNWLIYFMKTLIIFIHNFLH